MISRLIRRTASLRCAPHYRRRGRRAVGASAALVLLAAMAALAVSAPARAQGTSNALPDPISTREMLGYIERLGLSTGQARAVTHLHEQYKQEFRVLREGEIAQYLKDMQAMQMGGMMPQREQLESFLKRTEALMARIKAVDRRLFDHMMPLLTDGQAAMMPRIRDARARRRLSGQSMTGMMGRPAPDLSEIYLDLDLDAAAIERTDPLVAQYESRLTRRMRDLAAMTSRMYLDLFTAFEERGFTDEEMNDPAKAMEVMQAMQPIMEEIMGGIMAEARDLRDFNRRTYEQITGRLEDPHRTRFRNTFVQQAYPGATAALVHWDDEFAAAQRLDDLTPEQRDSVAALLHNRNTRLAGVLDRLMDAHETMTDSRSPFNFSREGMEEHQRALRELREEAEQIKADAREQLKSLLGGERFELARLRAKQDSRHFTGFAMTAETVTDAEEPAADDQPSLEIARGADPFLPGAITRVELNGYLAPLELTEDQQAIVEGLHESYLESYAELASNEIRAVTEAMKAMWQVDEAGGTAKPVGEEAYDALIDARRTVLAAIQRLDRALFDDLALAVADEDDAPVVAYARLVRECGSYRARSAFTFGPSPGREGEINLGAIVLAARLHPQDRAAVRDVLLEYQRSLLDLVRQQYDAALMQDRAQHLWQAKTMQSGGEGQTFDYDAYRETMESAMNASREANRRVAELNVECLGRVKQALSADGAAAVEAGYLRRAFPHVVDDPLDARAALQQAQALEDLDASQREQIRDVLVEYRPKYDDLTSRMIEIVRSTTPPGGFDQTGWVEYQAGQNALEKLRYERDEASAAAVATLRFMLSDEQIRRIGGLPELTDETQPGWRGGF